MNTIALGLHALAAAIWVGGMFFAIMVLRLSAGDLDPPVRVALWGRTFAKFFPWVWMSVIALPLTGYWMIFDVYGGFANTPMHVHIMHLTGLIMIAVYLFLWFVPYAAFKKALAAGEIPVAGSRMNTIRILVTTNLHIGLLTVLIGASGRYWGI